MLWLGLCFPELALEIFQRSEADPCVALCDRLGVLLASPAASTRGVQPGQRRATALALLPELSIVERDPVRETEALQQLAACALQFTPMVSLVRPGEDIESGLLLEVEPSLKLFHGLENLIELLYGQLGELGFTLRLGQAPTATGAWLLARHPQGGRTHDAGQLRQRLGKLPVSLLADARPHLTTLQQIGVRDIDQLLALPRPGLARRFGQSLLQELDRALGRRPDPRIGFDLPRRFDARLELLAGIEHAEGLMFAARHLLLQMTGWLNALQRGLREFELTIEHDASPATVLSLRTADATRDPPRLITLLREKLALVRLPSAAHALRLRCDAPQPLPDLPQDLFAAPGGREEDLGRLIERLQSRLGRDHVQRLLLIDDHRPEAAFRIEPLAKLPHNLGTAQETAPPGTALPEQLEGPYCGGLPRPLWLFDTPIALDEQGHRPFWRTPLQLLTDAERIETGWWDGHLVQRDYFVAQDAEHALYWIFRERLLDLDSNRGWFMQGRFG